MTIASQPKSQSLLESVANIAVGIFINITAQVIVLPLVLGGNIPFSRNLEIAGIFTVISIIRSYFLRRFFNFIHVTRVTHGNKR